MSEFVLAVDAGTGSGRAGLFDRGGNCLRRASRKWTATSPPALAPLGREYDPGVVEGALHAAIREAVGPDGARVVALSITGQRIGCAFVDDDGETLYLGPNADVRAMLGANLDDLDPDALYAQTGRFPPWIFAPARVRWLEAAEPALASRLRWVLDLPGWCLFRLGAEAAVDPTLAADLMMLDVRSGEPRTSRLPFPALGRAGQRVGALRPALAERLGLRADLPLVLGAADTQLAVLGGAREAGTTLVAGSSAPLTRAIPAPIEDPAGRLWLDPHALPGRWLLEANLGEMGTCHAWMARVIAGLDDDAEGWAAYDRLAAQADAGCDGASAHLGPRAMNLRALNTGRPAGLLMPFGETTGSPPGRPELLRAFLESCAYATRAGLAWLDAVSSPTEALHVVGGMSRSTFFGQLLADVVGAPVLAGPAEASLVGVGACAAVGAGWFASLEEAIDAMVRPPVRFEPSTTHADAYEDGYDRWREREALLEEA